MNDQTETVRRAPLPDRRAEDYVLTVTAGPDRGKMLSIKSDHPSRLLVGRSEACDLRLTDPEVSRRQCALEWVGDVLRLTDLGSSHGTFVDRVKVHAADLQGEETIRLGSTLLRVVAEESTAIDVPAATSFGKLVGASLEMRRLYPLCERLASSSVPVIIEGETGTGKEVLAEALHEQGPRAAGPFVVFDCTACAPSLVESELFGHERGAFTGAVAQRKGVFEQADGGTLFIDEIGDMELPVQARLLRALERSEVRRVGGDKWIRVDVRILSATRRNLDEEVEKGRFRDDLFHRLAVTRVELPPLRHRLGDIASLAVHFWRRQGGDPRALPPEVLRRWEAYGWPGNVRELRNAVSRQLAVGDLPASAALPMSSRVPPALALPGAGPDVFAKIVAEGRAYPQARERVLEEFEQYFVARVLEQHGGNVTHAAAASGIGRRHFQRLRARKGV